MAANARSGQEGSVGHAFWRIRSYLFFNLRGKVLELADLSGIN